MPFGLLAASARAQADEAEPTHVVIVRAQGDEALIGRIRAELEGGAFDVTELDARNVTTTVDLAAVGSDSGADAALRVQQRPTEIELWTARPAGDPDGTLDVIREPGATRFEQEVLVLRVVETLRALGLQPVAPARAPAPEAPLEPPPVAPTEPAPKAPEREPPANPEAPRAPASVPEPSPEHPASGSRVPQLWLEAAPALTLSPGGFAPQLQAQLGVRYQPVALFSISGFALAPLWRAALARDEGTATASTWILGLAGDVQLVLRPIELSAGAGIAAVITAMSAPNTSQLDGLDVTERTAAPFARAALHVELGASLRLGVRALIGASVPEVSMRFAGREVATWGRPFVIVSVGVELPLIAHEAAP